MSEISWGVLSESLVREWFELLRFPSISADPAHDNDCRAAATWLVEKARAAGAHDARLIETKGKPLVTGTFRGSAPGPRVVLYGHYDVQPVDPIESWTSPPFEPTERAGRVYARGAEDNKGQMWAAFGAVRELARAGKLAGEVVLLIEGEEEIGSPSLEAILPTIAAQLRADVVLVCDTNGDLAGRPGLTAGLRGIFRCTITLEGPGKDLHSGVHGGLAKNPAQELAHLLALLHDAQGRIAVPGYYEGVTQLSGAELATVERSWIGDDTYRSLTGVPPSGGEQGVHPALRGALHPTIDINGIVSGYGGPGSKTIIPARAVGKITSRIAPGQDPELLRNRFVSFIKEHAPRDLKLTIEDLDEACPAVTVPLGAPAVKRACDVIRHGWGIEPQVMWLGASIPIVAGLVAASGGVAVMVGCATEEDAIHAPNESYSIAQFKNMVTFVGEYLRVSP